MCNLNMVIAGLNGKNYLKQNLNDIVHLHELYIDASVVKFEVDKITIIAPVCNIVLYENLKQEICDIFDKKQINESVEYSFVLVLESE